MVVNTGTRLFDMLNDEVMTDVTFVVQGTEIKGHRVVASSQGGVLRELLENCKDNRVEISQDIAPHTFKTVLQYIYTDVCEVTGLNLFEVTHAAKTFDLDGLEEQCAETVRGKLSPTNIAAFTSQALLFSAEEYTKACQDYFRKHTLEVIKSEEFLEFPITVLLELCSSEGITCSELEVFLACVEWAKNECQRQKKKCTPENLRAVLGQVLSKIRFPCIPRKHFEDVVVPLEILTAEEVFQIVLGWTKKERKTQYSDKLRTENAYVREWTENTYVKVTLHQYINNMISHCKVSEIPAVPLSTRISELKSKISRGRVDQSKFDTLTLFHKGLELTNDMTLASIYTPGEELVLKIHPDITTVVTVRDWRVHYKFRDYKLPTVPLSTSIAELKAMKFIDESKRLNPAYTFILSHKGKELADDVTLASIHTPGEELMLEISLDMTTTVTVKNHLRTWNVYAQDSILPSVPLSTRISELKAMKIFNGCSCQYPADAFTLSHKGKELADDVTLASIHTPGEKGLELQLHSLNFTVRGVGQEGWELRITVNAQEFFYDNMANGAQIIKEYIYRHKNVHPDRVAALTGALCSLRFPQRQNAYPGAVVIAWCK